MPAVWPEDYGALGNQRKVPLPTQRTLNSLTEEVMFELNFDKEVFTREIKDGWKRTEDPRQREQHEQRPGGTKVHSVFREGAMSSVLGFGVEGSGWQWQRDEFNFFTSGFLHLSPHQFHSDHIKSLLDAPKRLFREQLS